MTVVHNKLPAFHGRADDGAALQRRLLQDLERQWLDSWTVADQIQAQAAPIAEQKSLPAEPTSVQADKLTNPGLSSSPPPSRDVVASRAQQTTGNTPSMRRAESQAQAPLAGPSQPPAPEPAAVESAQALNGASGHSGAAPSQQQAAQSMAVAQRERQATVSTVAEVPGPESQQLPSQAIGTPPGLSTMPAQHESDMDLSSYMAKAATGGPAAADLGGFKLQVLGSTLVTSTAPTPATADEEAMLGSSRATVKPLTQDSPEAGPRHLMLRELSDQDALASMRDTAFTSGQSKLAAEGLARALMESGYARVQVVVNGQLLRLDRNSLINPKAPSHVRDERSPTPTLNSQESRHGY